MLTRTEMLLEYDVLRGVCVDTVLRTMIALAMFHSLSPATLTNTRVCSVCDELPHRPVGDRRCRVSPAAVRPPRLLARPRTVAPQRLSRIHPQCRGGGRRGNCTGGLPRTGQTRPRVRVCPLRVRFWNTSTARTHVQNSTHTATPRLPRLTMMFGPNALGKGMGSQTRSLTRYVHSLACRADVFSLGVPPHSQRWASNMPWAALRSPRVYHYLGLARQGKEDGRVDLREDSHMFHVSC